MCRGFCFWADASANSGVYRTFIAVDGCMQPGRAPLLSV